MLVATLPETACKEYPPCCCWSGDKFSATDLNIALLTAPNQMPSLGSFAVFGIDSDRSSSLY
jgi:hypothetical protein